MAVLLDDRAVAHDGLGEDSNLLVFLDNDQLQSVECPNHGWYEDLELGVELLVKRCDGVAIVSRLSDPDFAPEEGRLRKFVSVVLRQRSRIHAVNLEQSGCVAVVECGNILDDDERVLHTISVLVGELLEMPEEDNPFNGLPGRIVFVQNGRGDFGSENDHEGLYYNKASVIDASPDLD